MDITLIVVSIAKQLLVLACMPAKVAAVEIFLCDLMQIAHILV